MNMNSKKATSSNGRSAALFLVLSAIGLLVYFFIQAFDGRPTESVSGQYIFASDAGNFSKYAGRIWNKTRWREKDSRRYSFRITIEGQHPSSYAKITAEGSISGSKMFLIGLSLESWPLVKEKGPVQHFEKNSQGEWTILRMKSGNGVMWQKASLGDVANIELCEPRIYAAVRAMEEEVR